MVETRENPLTRRMSGVLLHPTSLPGSFPIGTLGPEASAFIQVLARAKQRCWQMLPIGPTQVGGSPYTSPSAFAGNTWLLGFEPLAELGWIEQSDRYNGTPGGATVDFHAAERRAEALATEAYAGFQSKAGASDRADFEAFGERESYWLDDYTLFKALRDQNHQRAWTDWPRGLVTREPAALAAARSELAEAVALEQFAQFLFERQWRSLKALAEEAGIALVGDIPIYVAHDSADVWSHQDLFDLDENGRPINVAGVPPDYFSDTGQRWGNPLYRWDVLEERGYEWWAHRFERTFERFDVVRIDHFRGFEAYWSIPSSEPTAVIGEWIEGPRDDLFLAVERALGGKLPVIAEDLGVITDEVRALRDRLELPGMAIVEFAFDGDPRHPYLPENVRERSVIYPGTHDNDTVRGWYDKLAEHERHHVDAYFHGRPSDPAWALIEACWRSPAGLAIAQLQDILSLGTEARLNVPGQAEGNWAWRQDDPSELDRIIEPLARLTEETGRAAP